MTYILTNWLVCSVQGVPNQTMKVYKTSNERKQHKITKLIDAQICKRTQPPSIVV
jgi:hypothetical protein